MIWVRSAGEAVTWSSWLLRHRAEFGAILRTFADGLPEVIVAHPEDAVRRVGNTLVAGTPGGGERVLAFIEQVGPRVEHIEQAVSDLGSGQAALATSLEDLRTVSMVTLALSALTPGALVAQFGALDHRLDGLQRQLARLHKKFVADLKAGLGLLNQNQDLLESGERGPAPTAG